VLLDQGQLVQHDTPEVLLERPATAFAARFLGADRALKRLSRKVVADHAHRAPRVVMEDGRLGAVSDGPSRFVWVTDVEGRLLGSLDLALLESGVEPASVLSPAGEDMALSREASLREALSVMVGSGARALPVIDGGRLWGEIRLSDIEGVGQQGTLTPLGQV